MKPPVTIAIVHSDVAHRDLSEEAEQKWYDTHELLIPSNPDDFEQDPEMEALELLHELPKKTYFDKILEVLRRYAILELR